MSNKTCQITLLTGVIIIIKTIHIIYLLANKLVCIVDSYLLDLQIATETDDNNDAVKRGPLGSMKLEISQLLTR